MKRRLLFGMVGGSHNHGLDDENSDVDRKEFYVPTFLDMFHNVKIEDTKISESVDVVVKDIRSLVNLFTRANPDSIEILFSKEFTTNEETEEFFNLLYNLRDDIAKMNLPGFISCCLGTALNSMKWAAKTDDESRKGKELMRAYRVLDLFLKYYGNGFTDFGSALSYSGEEREFMLRIKSGEIPYGEALKLVKGKEKEVLNLKEEIFKNHSEEEFKETKRRLEAVLEAVTMEFVARDLSTAGSN